MEDRWAKVAALIHHSAAAFYYLYKLFISSGLIGTVVFSLILIHQRLTHQAILPVLLSLIISLGVVLAGVVFWAKIQTSQQFQSHNPGLRILSSEVTYAHLNNNKYSQSVRIIAKALQHGVKSYEQKFYWTGEGKIIPSIDDPRQKIHLFKEQDGPRQICKIDFERPQKPNDKKININYKLDLIDDAQKAQRFLRHNVYCKMTKLVLRVQFSNEDNIKSYKRQIFMSPVSEVPIKEWEFALPLDSREAFWEIPKPKISFKYQIIW